MAKVSLKFGNQEKEVEISEEVYLRVVVHAARKGKSINTAATDVVKEKLGNNASVAGEEELIKCIEVGFPVHV